MDIAIFKATRVRLVAWIVIPPVFITAVGLSAYAWMQQAQWRLQKTQSLSEALPTVIEARKGIEGLFLELGLSKEKRIASEDQLISLLNDSARDKDVLVESVQVVRRDNSRGAGVPVLNAIVEASSGFTAFQYYLNEVKAAQPLLHVSSILLEEREDAAEEQLFEYTIVFELLLVDDVLASGGSI